MRYNAGDTYTVIVWNNDSYEEFRQWVEQEYKPDIFIRSGKVGKNVARASLFSEA